MPPSLLIQGVTLWEEMCVHVSSTWLDFTPVGAETSKENKPCDSLIETNSTTSTLSFCCAAGPHLQDYFVIFLLLIEKNLNMTLKKGVSVAVVCHYQKRHYSQL